jgi:hypothetical protein
MAMAKLMCWQFAVEHAGSEDVMVMRTDWARFGITGPALLRCVRKHVPQFDAKWAKDRDPKVNNDAEKSRALWGRLWHMYRKRKRGTGSRPAIQCITVEHPQRSARLRPYVESAIRIYQFETQFVVPEETV